MAARGSPPPRLDPSVGGSGPCKTSAGSEVERCPPGRLEPTRGAGAERGAQSPALWLRPGLCVSFALASHPGSPFDLPDLDHLARPDPTHRRGLGFTNARASGGGGRSPQRDLGARWATGQGPSWDARPGESRCFRLGPESPDWVKIRLLHSLWRQAARCFRFPSLPALRSPIWTAAAAPLKCGQWPPRLSVA